MSDNDFINAMRAGLGPLACLSLQHPARGSVPVAPTNEDRVRTFRNMLPVVHGNNYEWPFRRGGLHAAAGWPGKAGR